MHDQLTHDPAFCAERIYVEKLGSLIGTVQAPPCIPQEVDSACAVLAPKPVSMHMLTLQRIVIHILGHQ